MKALIAVMAFIALVVAAIAGITVFLGPNDLSGCRDTPTDSSVCAAADAIVAVSGGDTDARTDAAIERYRNGWAPLLIFSGAAHDPSSPSNALSMKKRAIKAGVPEQDVVIEEFARNTAENAVNTSQFINERNVSRIILVTSPYHQRRAALEFNARLGETVQIVNAPVAADSQWDRWWWLHPRGWWLAGSELIKIVAYYTSGGNT